MRMLDIRRPCRGVEAQRTVGEVRRGPGERGERWGQVTQSDTVCPGPEDNSPN